MVKNREKNLDPDEIFIDSSNLPNFDVHQFEGRIEKSISRRTLFILGTAFLIIFLIFISKVWSLQINQGEFYFTKSENNRLRNSLIFAHRGVIYDRNGLELAWNTENPEEKSFDLRKYISLDGFAHLLGYLKYPSKDKYGFYYTDVFDGKDGIEKAYNTELSGENGKRIVEVDALGKLQSENIIQNPNDGENLKLSIDAGLQNQIFKEIKDLSNQVGFSGGAGVIMDINSGEVLALTSYPEYNSQVLTDGQNKIAINRYLADKNKPFLNRVVDGLYTPGSTVKPYMAFAALNENIIDPLQNILSTGSISLPNPYDPTKPTIFKDWKAHGYVDMRKALAVSSDVYFYEVGGGFENQKGLGIINIDKYMKLFGFGSAVPVSSSFFTGPTGVIPNPEWKAANFEGEEWRVGNTYHTAIGQYGFQVSPLQLVRAVAALANGGKLLTPTIILNSADGDVSDNVVDLKLDPANLKVVREGMRDGVTKDYGVARGLNSVDYSVAAKTGTAELGVYKQFVNSWVSGFFPYENPKYAFVIIMEKGPVTNTTGALSIMRQTLDWLAQNKPEYLK
jgi:penicillin-binding protein 2